MRPTIVDFLNSFGLTWLAWAVPTDGVLYAVMFVTLIWLFLRRGRVAGLPETRVLEVAVAAAVGAAVGTRAYYLIVVSTASGMRLRDLFNPQLGTASWGAYVGAAVGIGAYCLITRTRPMPYLDTAASCAPLGTVIGRWACFMRGDDYGATSSLPWAVSFPTNSIPYNDHLAAGLIDRAATASLAVHPFQIYLSLNALFVFLIVTAVWKRYREIPGRTMSAYLIIYGATRFSWEFLRAPGAGGPDGGLSSSQWMALTMMVAGSAILVVPTLKGRLGGALSRAGAS